MLRVVLAGLHLLALGVGLFAVVYRGSALREAITESSLKRAFKFDTLWGIAAGLWIVTGLWRFLGSIEKPMAYYEQNSLFRLKMGALVLILILEIWPMITLIRWRIQLKKGTAITTIATTATAQRIAIICHVQALLIVIMVFAAVGMARGFGAG
jgi:putative membrane protein